MTTEIRHEEYLEHMRMKFEEILDQERWDLVEYFFEELEKDGYGAMMSQFSQMMTTDEVKTYTQWKHERIETLKEKYRHAAADGDWQTACDVGVELEEMGLGELEVELSHELTKKQVAEYRKWDRAVNGSVATQMDDTYAN